MSKISTDSKLRRRKISSKTRKLHRILGLIIGFQFLLWVLSGVYFSWTDIHSVRSSDWVDPIEAIDHSQPIFYPHEAIKTLENSYEVGQIYKVQLLAGARSPIFAIHYTVLDESNMHVALADARTGKLRPQLSEAEARAIALEAYKKDNPIQSISLISETNPHHEYRAMPLPAFAVKFDDSRDTTIYISVNEARITSVRNNQWRVFDFLWMLHTMDFAGRDNINNIQLRGFSVFGLFVILSGYLLFYFTRRRRRHNI